MEWSVCDEELIWLTDQIIWFEKNDLSVLLWFVAPHETLFLARADVENKNMEQVYSGEVTKAITAI